MSTVAIGILTFVAGMGIGILIKTALDSEYHLELEEVATKATEYAECAINQKDAEIIRLHDALRNAQITNAELQKKLQH